MNLARRARDAALSLVLLLSSAVAADATWLPVSGFQPNGNTATPLSVSTGSAEEALPSGPVVEIVNTGANPVFCHLGTSGSVTASTSDIEIGPNGGSRALQVGANTNIACITAAGPSSVNLVAGTGYDATSGGLLSQILGILGLNGSSIASSSNPLPTTSNNDIVVSETISLSASAYSSGYCVGGLITISGLTPNAVYTLQYLHATITPAPSAALSAVADIFDANPTSSTYTDNAAAVLASADAVKRVVRSASGSVTSVSGETTFVLNAFSASATGVNSSISNGSTTLPIEADSGGNIYVAIVTGAAFNALTSGKLIVRADLRR